MTSNFGKFAFETHSKTITAVTVAINNNTRVQMVKLLIKFSPSCGLNFLTNLTFKTHTPMYLIYLLIVNNWLNWRKFQNLFQLANYASLLAHQLRKINEDSVQLEPTH